MKELFTVIVISYNNLTYFEEVIQSVLSQDYPAIQLIVSDDGSENFHLYDLESIIQKYRRLNIVDIIINHNEHNLGTVKHLEVINHLIKGEYVTILAADDAYYDGEVISSFHDAFCQRNGRYGVVSSHVGMYDQNLQEFLGMYNTEEEVSAINSKGREAVLDHVCGRCLFAAMGTAYRTSIYRRIRDLSKEYRYIEDWPSYIRLAFMEDVEFYFIDRVTGKHRSGGTSHPDKLSAKHLFFWFETLHIFNTEILPYLYKLSLETSDKAVRLNEDRVYRFLGHVQTLFTGKILFGCEQSKKAEARIKQLERELGNITGSRVWRVVQPLRKMKQFIKNHRMLRGASRYDA